MTLQVFRSLLDATAEEMGAALRRAAYSPNIKERRDYSCAVFDSLARAVALGDHMPVHLGAMPMSVEAVLGDLGDLAPGDVAIVNDPFRGGTHLPDITLVAPVHLDARGERGGSGGSGPPLGYVAARAHHSDVGGMSPGSMPLAREIHQEGVRIPPLLLDRGGRRNHEVWSLILANVRTPDERAGDLDAQLAALHTGRVRLLEIAENRGARLLREAMDELIRHADRLMREALRLVPDGIYEAEDAMEDDGFGSGPLPIRVALTVRGSDVHLDFSGTADEAVGGVNAVAAITSSAVRYVLRCLAEALVGEGVPAGGGSLDCVQMTLPERCLVNAGPPRSVAAGNVETSQRITDVLLTVFGLALPDLVPALSQGTMNNLTVGGFDPRTGTPYAYYETVGGGMGAGPGAPGLSGVHTHMSNSLNTPIEALEHAYPFRIVRYALRRGSGGGGLHRGGDGLIRDLQVLGDADVTILSERRVTGPPGARGGEPGAPGLNRHRSGERVRTLPGKVQLRVQGGDVISVASPGGGGWGAAPAGPG